MILNQRIYRNYLLFFATFLTFISIVEGQNNNPKNKYPIKFHGGVGLTGMYNTTFNERPRLIPWSYGISGNLSMTVGKFNVPVSLYYSQNGLGFKHNFNRIGISPSYKSLKLHLGYRSMTFSPYVLNGNTFLGVGLEFKYKWLRVAAMKGKLRNLTAFSIDRPILGLESLKDYNRDVLTFKIGFGFETNYFDLIFFKGKDQVNAIFEGDQRPNIDYKYFPKDNIAFGFNSKFSIKRTFFFSTNIMASAYSENAVSESIDMGDFSFLSSVYKPNVTTQIGAAGKADAYVRIKTVNIGASYERVSPQFKTLGRYYNLNDTERKRLTLSLKLKYLNLSTSYGIEKNELASTNINSNIRNIISFNAVAKISNQIRLRATFSNYNIDNSPSILNDNDTLKVTRVLTNALFSPRFSFGNNIKHSIRIVGMYRTVDNTFAYQKQNSSTEIYRARLNYSANFKNTKFKIGTNLSYQLYNYIRINKENFAFGIFISKSLLKDKIKTRINTSYTIMNVIGKSNGFGLNNNLSINYSPFKRHGINFSISYFLRNRNVGENISELRSRISYQFTF